MAFSPGDYSDWSLRGEGGEAEIFRARQISLDRLVAIKRLKLASIGDADDIGRFEREAKLCASLIHPNLLPIFDYGSEGKFYYLVMEFVHGVDLGKIADLPGGQIKPSPVDVTSLQTRTEKPPLPESLKVHLARQMVEVVDFIEQKGILHRDLKPENFMADSAARIKLLDLGMAMVQSQMQTDPKREVLKGTLAYIPPEILRGQGHLGRVSEHYSLALVILELFLGTRYYRGKSREEVVELIQSGLVWEEMQGVPVGVRLLLSPYLNADPAKRPKSLEPLLKGLKGLQGNTLAISGGREAMTAVIRREQHAWLWAMVNASEAEGRIEDALTRLKELLENDPDDDDAQARFQELGMKFNEATGQMPSIPDLHVVPNRYSELSDPAPIIRSRSWLIAALVLLALAALGGTYYLQGGRVKDMGTDLMERERSQLSFEDQAASGTVGESALMGARKPSLRPFGVLVVSGIPANYRLLVNRVLYPIAGEIHLPATRHLLEIRDEANHSVLKDSVTIGGGEPTVFDFHRRMIKP